MSHQTEGFIMMTTLALVAIAGLFILYFQKGC